MFVRVRGSFVLALALAAFSGCGGESSSADSGSGGSGAAGTGATSGSGGGSGGGGSGGASTGGSATGGSETVATTSSGAGGPPPTARCPEAIPVPETECLQNGPTCYYGDCEDGQRTVAICLASGWTLEARPCTSFFCTEECQPGEICRVLQGGAYLAECIPNPCGTGPVTCQCVSPGCGPCWVNDSSGGITVTCDTCPDGACP